MIPQEIKDFIYLIKNGRNTTSYKMVWAKALVEIINENENIDSIEISMIAEKIIGYYWDQTIYFDLNQSNNPNSPPTIISIIKKELIPRWLNNGRNKKMFYYKAKKSLETSLPKVIKSIVVELKKMY